MNYKNELPPNDIYQKCHDQFGVEWDEGILFTYGDTVYSKFPFDDEYKAHEEVHVEQQAKIGADMWWEIYLSNPNFRLIQELEAYKAQIAYGLQHYNRHARRNQRRHIIKSLTTLYGDICTKEEADKLLG